MVWTHASSRVVCGLLSLLLAGCYMNSPYGGYPGMYGPQPMHGPPGGPMLAPGNAVPAQPAFPQSGQRQIPGRTEVAPNPRSDAPAFDAERDGVDSDNRVPDYRDPTDTDNDAGRGFQNPKSGNEPFGESPFGEKKSSDSDPFPSGDDDRSGVRLDGIDDASFGRKEDSGGVDEVFQPPIPIKSASSTTELDDIASGRRPNPYRYDSKAYTWLQGVVDYDAESKTWHIVYDLNPNDRYGGGIVLVDDPELKRIRSGDVVLIEGRVDSTATDEFGKPRYRIEKLHGPLKPKK